MSKFVDKLSENAAWYRASGKLFELRTDSNEIIITMKLVTSMFSSFIEGTFQDQVYTLKRVGFFTMYVIVRRAEEENDIAILRIKSGKGNRQMKFANGHLYMLDCEGLFCHKRYWTNKQGEKVLYLKHESVGLWKAKTTVTPTKHSNDVPDLPLLTMTGFYVMWLLEQRRKTVTLS